MWTSTFSMCCWFKKNRLFQILYLIFLTLFLAIDITNFRFIYFRLRILSRLLKLEKLKAIFGWVDNTQYNLLSGLASWFYFQALEKDIVDLVRPHSEFEPATRVHEAAMLLFIKEDYTELIRKYLIEKGF